MNEYQRYLDAFCAAATGVQPRAAEHTTEREDAARAVGIAHGASFRDQRVTDMPTSKAGLKRAVDELLDAEKGQE